MIPVRPWIQHLLQNPSAREDFFADLEARKNQCYHQALDQEDADIAALVGEKNTYQTLISTVKHAMTDPQKELDDITAYLFQKV